MDNDEGRVTDIDPIEREFNADLSMRVLLLDLGGGAFERDQFNELGRDENGRFAYILKYKGGRYSLLMPGSPLDQVRFMDYADQDINVDDFELILVNGESLLWGPLVMRLAGRVHGE